MAKASGSSLPFVAALAVLAGAAFAVFNFLNKKGDDKEDGEAGSGPTIQAARSKDASDDANAIVPPSPAGEFHDASHEFVEESPRGTPVNIASRFAVEATPSAEADKDPKLTNGKHDDDVEFVEAPSDPPAEEEEEKAAEEEAVEAEAAEPEPAVDAAVDGIETEAAPEVVEAVPEVVGAVPEVVEETKEEEATSEVVQDGAVESVEEEEEGEEETQDTKVDELLERAQGAMAKTDKVLEENAPKA